jgi:hypothetical protein
MKSNLSASLTYTLCVAGVRVNGSQGLFARLIALGASGPNPSIERTCPGKPGPAAHVER